MDLNRGLEDLVAVALVAALAPLVVAALPLHMLAMSARKRRMKTSMVVDVSLASLMARPSGRVPPSGVLQPTPRLAVARRHMPAMSFSTRSSTERNGSLHSTVRWAWSFSLRCTQSTVKSRRFS